MAADPTTKLCLVSVVLLLALVSSLQVSFRLILLYILLLLVLCAIKKDPNFVDFYCLNQGVAADNLTKQKLNSKILQVLSEFSFNFD